MVTKLNELDRLLSKHFDVFIASASYEKRCLSVMNIVLPKLSFNQKLVTLSTPHKLLMNDNLDVFKNSGFQIIEVNNSNQIQTVNNLTSKISEILTEKLDSSFLIDVSTFTRQTLLILLRILRNILSEKNKIQFLYTPASEYSIGLPYKDKWLSHGVLFVNSVFGYSGIIRPSRPYHLIILMGFEVERASVLIHAYEPTKITVGYAKKNDSVSDEYYYLNKSKCEELREEFPYLESFEFSCVDIYECKNDILSQTLKHRDYNVIVSPMNNKISTVSCALTAFANDEVQLAIAIPAVYNHENYSIPGEYCHLLDISDFIK
jgi:hypothetical protein